MKFKNLSAIFVFLLFVVAGPIASEFQADADEHFDEPQVTVTSICSGQTVPAGWAVVDVRAESNTCGVGTQSIPLIWNVLRIEDLSPYPVGTTKIVCKRDSSYLPPDWTILETLGHNNVCGVVTQQIPLIYNVHRIKRITGPTPTPTPVPNANPIGAFESANDGLLWGWAIDPNTPNENLSIEFFVDGTDSTGTRLDVELKTYVPRSDVNTSTGYSGNHGFSLAIPRNYFDGQEHKIRAYAVDSCTGGRRLLSDGYHTFRQYPGSPIGKIDSVGSDGIVRGWALDPGNASANLTVHFYLKGKAGGGGVAIGDALANIYRPDVNTSTNYSGNHGFEFAIPAAYRNSQTHAILVYAFDVTGDPYLVLPDSPKLFKFSNPFVSRTLYDFNGDGKADQNVFRSGAWHHSLSPLNTYLVNNFGIANDKPVAADYDGDGKTDLAIYRNGNWWITNSGSSQTISVNFGLSSDIPVPADYDGDGKADIAIYRNDNGTGTWWMIKSTTGLSSVSYFGSGTDSPVPADYDGDGRADLAVTRQTASGLTWLAHRTTSGPMGIQFGLNADITSPADYDGDGRTDLAVFRSGYWYVLKSSGGSLTVPFGQLGDTPVSSDFDGDGKVDIAIYRNNAGAGEWWYLSSIDGQGLAVPFGLGTDVPVNKR